MHHAWGILLAAGLPILVSLCSVLYLRHISRPHPDSALDILFIISSVLGGIGAFIVIATAALDGMPTALPYLLLLIPIISAVSVGLFRMAGALKTKLSVKK